MNIEDAVIGTLLKEPHLLNDTTIRPEHFESVQNRRTLEAMMRLKAEGKQIDIITLLSVGNPKELGSMSRLNDISRLTNSLKFDSYTSIVTDNWRNRQKRALLHTAAQEDWAIEKISSELDKLVDDKTDDRHSIKDLLAAAYEKPWIEKKIQDSLDVELPTLQEITNGLRDSELTIIGARPSMGKSDVMLQLAYAAGNQNYVPVLHSLEMSAENLTDRIIAATGRFNRYRMSDPHKLLTDKQKDRWHETLDMASGTGIEIFDKAAQTVAEIRMKSRKIKNENPDKKMLIVVDYLTIIKPNEASGFNKHHQVSDITKELKELAKEFKCPVVCLAQLSRDIDRREDKRPNMSDLRESGGIEESADVIAFLYREAYYNPECEFPRVMEINIAKQRNGATGTVFVDYDKTTGVLT